MILYVLSPAAPCDACEQPGGWRCSCGSRFCDEHITGLTRTQVVRSGKCPMCSHAADMVEQATKESPF